MRAIFNRVLSKKLKPLADLTLTLVYWTYFTIGYVFLFFPFHLFFFLFSANRQLGFQKVNHLFFKGFFSLIGAVTPGLNYAIEPEVRKIRSSIIVSNHVSYLDPILLVSLYEKQKTIVKSVFFKMPIFGWVLKQSGYIPSGGHECNQTILEQIEMFPDYLASGGNLFAYPEGTRARQGRIGEFRKGVFKIAKRYGAPIKVLFIQNTDRLFVPGKFRFDTCVRNTVRLELIGEICPDKLDGKLPISEIAAQVRMMMIEKNLSVNRNTGESNEK